MGRSLLLKGLGGVGRQEEGFGEAGPARVEWGEARPPSSSGGVLRSSVVPRPQGTFQQMWISKQEYEEGGKQCVERKCP